MPPKGSPHDPIAAEVACIEDELGTFMEDLRLGVARRQFGPLRRALRRLRGVDLRIVTIGSHLIRSGRRTTRIPNQRERIKHPSP